MPPETLNKRGIIDAILSERGEQGVRVHVQTVVEQLFRVMGAQLSMGGRIEIRGFGVFEIQQRAARTGSNPRTGAPVPIPARKVVKFKAGKELQDSIR